MTHFKINNRDQTLLLDFSSHSENIDRAITEVMNYIKKESDFDNSFEINLILREIINNAIKHGNKNDPEKKVKIKLLLENGEWQFNIKDEGHGFDLSKELKHKSDTLTPHGMGLSIISSLGYGLHYNNVDKSLSVKKG